VDSISTWAVLTSRPARHRAEISDDGRAERGLEKLFTPSNDQGPGLGLAIARKLVEEHGGSLRLQSRFGEGTTVRVVLPAAETR
jgi:signal transduction histidine kinase